MLVEVKAWLVENFEALLWREENNEVRGSIWRGGEMQVLSEGNVRIQGRESTKNRSGVFWTEAVGQTDGPLLVRDSNQEVAQAQGSESCS